MPPRSALSSLSVSDAANEVVCPLKNHDGSACRKRCIGEKRYRSMQEHIRRAHPEHYIPKLPATEESFSLMVSTPPSADRAAATAVTPNSQPRSNGPPSDYYYNKDDYAYPAGPVQRAAPYRRTSLLPAANAAEALAQLHNHRPWDEADLPSDPDSLPRLRHALYLSSDPTTATSDPYRRPLLPSSLDRSPPYRSSTLPPGGRGPTKPRPRKSSNMAQSARRAKHERARSRGPSGLHARRASYERKAMSAEPSAAAVLMGKRWEDLIDAAASATEEDSRDLTPVPPSPSPHRASLPPIFHLHPTSQPAAASAGAGGGPGTSPLHTAHTPPPGLKTSPPSVGALPSVESPEGVYRGGVVGTGSSGSNFSSSTGSGGVIGGLGSGGGSVQIYCAGCKRLSILGESYACTECICGLCAACVDVIAGEARRGRGVGCPVCRAVGGKFRPFRVDVR
ncbi:hypothetical protein EJ06DRAFT_557088 [Trichodelitschia bisporula]|uniref:RING zinc finger-like domain-containing protein n=1 Tax=Trichodelitschia bisporula TaxID=703511 RepID=A0A6G1HVC4_9PEZI|nr:hypothetical protein EJ06DRAFT_557088 [Trichodelitschia bisporula]